MKTALMETALLARANEELRKLPWFEEGMAIATAEMQGHVLLMRAAGMTNEQGAVRADLVEKFDGFERWFSGRYTLARPAHS